MLTTSFNLNRATTQQRCRDGRNNAVAAAAHEKALGRSTCRATEGLNRTRLAAGNGVLKWARLESNQHALAGTRPSTLRVCQFRHEPDLGTPDGWPRPAEARSVSLPARLLASRTGAARMARGRSETPYFSGPLPAARGLRPKRCRRRLADRSPCRPWPPLLRSGAPARASSLRSWRAPGAVPRTFR
jgi:hypothetical protein